MKIDLRQSAKFTIKNQPINSIRCRSNSAPASRPRTGLRLRPRPRIRHKYQFCPSEFRPALFYARRKLDPHSKDTSRQFPSFERQHKSLAMPLLPLPLWCAARPRWMKMVFGIQLEMRSSAMCAAPLESSAVFALAQNCSGHWDRNSEAPTYCWIVMNQFLYMQQFGNLNPLVEP